MSEGRTSGSLMLQMIDHAEALGRPAEPDGVQGSEAAELVAVLVVQLEPVVGGDPPAAVREQGLDPAEHRAARHHVDAFAQQLIDVFGSRFGAGFGVVAIGIIAGAGAMALERFDCFSLLLEKPLELAGVLGEDRG